MEISKNLRRTLASYIDPDEKVKPKMSSREGSRPLKAWTE